MNKLTFIKNLITILWAETWPSVCWYVGGFSVIGAILFTIGQISLWCGMPPMGTEGWGNAISHVPQLDNGLAIIAFGAFFIGFPIAIICIITKAAKEFATELRDIVRQAGAKSNEITNKPNNHRTPEQKMADADMRDFNGNPN